MRSVVCWRCQWWWMNAIKCGKQTVNERMQIKSFSTHSWISIQFECRISRLVDSSSEIEAVSVDEANVKTWEILLMFQVESSSTLHSLSSSYSHVVLVVSCYHFRLWLFVCVCEFPCERNFIGKLAFRAAAVNPFHAWQKWFIVNSNRFAWWQNVKHSGVSERETLLNAITRSRCCYSRC